MAISCQIDYGMKNNGMKTEKMVKFEHLSTPPTHTHYPYTLHHLNFAYINTPNINISY